MAIGSGLGGQVGFKKETTVGTGVTVDKFARVRSAKIQKKKNVAQGGGLSAGQTVQPGARRVVTSTWGEGSIELEPTKKGFGTWLAHLMGSTSSPVQQGATTAYLQTHSLADNYGLGLTIQQGIPDRAGTVRPYTFAGCKILGGEFSCGMNEILVATFDIDAMSVTEATGLAAASYTASNGVFHSGLMNVKTGTFGSEAAITGVKGVTIKIERPSQTDAFYASASPGTKAEPVMNDYVKITGTLETDFVDKTQLADLFSADTSTSLVVEWVGATIASTFKETLRFKIPQVFFDDGAPTLDGPDVVGLSVPFTAQYDETNAPCIVEYMSTDTAV